MTSIPPKAGASRTRNRSIRTCSLVVWALPTVACASVQVVFNGGVAQPAVAATEYSTIMGLEEGVWGATLSDREGLVATAGTLARLRVKLDTAPGAGTSYTFALMLNGAPSALSCTVSGTSTGCTDTTNAVAVAAGDPVAIRSVPAGTPAATHVALTMTFDGTTAKESIYVGGSGSGALSNSSDRSLPVHGVYNNGATAVASWQTHVIAPTSGNFKNLFVRLSVAPGGTASRTFTAQRNDVATTLACTIVGAATTCSDTTNSFTVVAGDTVRVLESPSAVNPASATAQLGIAFVADTDGEFMLVQSGAAGLSSTLVNYVTPAAGRNNTADTIEANHVVLGQACTVKRIFSNLNGPPGAGTSFRLTLRVNGVDSVLGCTMADAATSCNAAADVTIGDDALLSNQSTPSGGPTLRSSRITYLVTSAGPPAARRIWFVQ